MSYWWETRWLDWRMGVLSCTNNDQLVKVVYTPNTRTQTHSHTQSWDPLSSSESTPVPILVPKQVDCNMCRLSKLLLFFFCKDGSDRLMKRASYPCCIFLCVVLAAAYLKYRWYRLSCLPFVWHFFHCDTHTHTHTHTHWSLNKSFVHLRQRTSPGDDSSSCTSRTLNQQRLHQSVVQYLTGQLGLAQTVAMQMTAPALAAQHSHSWQRRQPLLRPHKMAAGSYQSQVSQLGQGDYHPSLPWSLLLWKPSGWRWPCCWTSSTTWQHQRQSKHGQSRPARCHGEYVLGCLAARQLRSQRPQQLYWCHGWWRRARPQPTVRRLTKSHRHQRFPPYRCQSPVLHLCARDADGQNLSQHRDLDQQADKNIHFTNQQIHLW